MPVITDEGDGGVMMMITIMMTMMMMMMMTMLMVIIVPPPLESRCATSLTLRTFGCFQAVEASNNGML